jgi:hypothetical protein
MSKTKRYEPIYLLIALALVLSLGIVAAPMVATVGADGEVTILAEDFEGGLPGDWTVDTAAGWDWRDDDPKSRGPLDGCSGIFMIADSEWCGPSPMNTTLITPSIDCSAFDTVVLEFDHYFRFAQFFGGVEKGDVDVWDGTMWHTEAHYKEGPDVYGHVTIDISDVAAGKSGVKIRWHYYGANIDYCWEVDNVDLSGVAAPVGGEAYPVNKAGVILPWAALGLAVVGGSLVALRRCKAQS